MRESLDKAQLFELTQHYFEIRKHEFAIALILDLPMEEVQSPTIAYPFMSKSELAAVANMTPRTLRRFLRQHQAELIRMGVPKNAKTLTPKAVEFLCEHLVIDISVLQKIN